MADDLCKKHSLGYEPLKVIGLSVAGKSCLLCLAEENTRLRVENERLKGLWEKALPFEMVPDEIQYLKLQTLQKEKEDGK